MTFLLGYRHFSNTMDLLSLLLRRYPWNKQICIHACIHTYMHIYVYTYIHTYIHTLRQNVSPTLLIAEICYVVVITLFLFGPIKMAEFLVGHWTFWPQCLMIILTVLHSYVGSSHSNNSWSDMYVHMWGILISFLDLFLTFNMAVAPDATEEELSYAEKWRYVIQLRYILPCSMGVESFFCVFSLSAM